MPKLDGRTALVTGGNSGIGLAAARALAKEGAQVYITGRRQRELATAVEEIGSNAVGVLGDVSNLGDLDRLFEQIRREKGRLDILFANAGIAKYGVLGEIQRNSTIRFSTPTSGCTVHCTKGAPAYAGRRLDHSQRFGGSQQGSIVE